MYRRQYKFFLDFLCIVVCIGQIVHDSILKMTNINELQQNGILSWSHPKGFYRLSFEGHSVWKWHKSLNLQLISSQIPIWIFALKWQLCTFVTTVFICYFIKSLYLRQNTIELVLSKYIKSNATTTYLIEKCKNR